MCDSTAGNYGSTTKCLKINNFDTHQRATCLPASEVITRSSYTSACADSCRSYCFLSCMAENHGMSSGTVTSDCMCTPYYTIDIWTGLPFWCFYTQGKCTFFDSCLKCTNNPVIDLKTQCQWFSNNLLNYANCSTREWIREVRVCFQNFYISHINSTQPTDCTEIANNYYYPAFDSCLRMATSNSLDFCSLPSLDRSSIYSALTQLYNTTLRTAINSTLNWMNSC